MHSESGTINVGGILIFTFWPPFHLKKLCWDLNDTYCNVTQKHSSYPLLPRAKWRAQAELLPTCVCRLTTFEWVRWLRYGNTGLCFKGVFIKGNKGKLNPFRGQHETWKQGVLALCIGMFLCLWRILFPLYKQVKPKTEQTNNKQVVSELCFFFLPCTPCIVYVHVEVWSHDLGMTPSPVAS